MKPTEIITKYEDACQEFADYFGNRYFGKDRDQWWVADCVGHVLHINDRFFSMDDMHEYVKNKYSAKDIFQREDEEIDYLMEKHTSDGFPNIYNWKRLKK